MGSDAQIAAHRYAFQQRWEPILTSCRDSTIASGKEGCRRAGVSDPAFCEEEVSQAAWKLYYQLGYWAGSPGLAWMTDLINKGPEDPKYLEIFNEVRNEHESIILHRSGAAAEEDIRKAAADKYSSKGMAAITRAFVESMVQPRTKIPRDVRERLARQTQEVVDASLATYDQCLRRGWR